MNARHLLPALTLAWLPVLAGCSNTGNGFLSGFDRPADPTADAEQYFTDENTPLHVDASDGVLANDTTEYPASFEAVLATPPQHGTLALAPDGSFDYTPDTSFFGDDAFEYVATDPIGKTAPVAVGIRVDRGFLISVDIASLELTQGSSATLTVTIEAIDDVEPPPTVDVTLEPVPPGVSAAPFSVVAGTAGTLVIGTTASTPQLAWTDLAIRGTLGPRTADALFSLRIRGPSLSLDTTLAGGAVHFGLTFDTGCYKLAIQPDQKIVAVGYARRVDMGPVFPIVARFDSEGALDPDFANGGYWQASVGQGGSFDHVFLEPNGKIVVVGYVSSLVGGQGGWYLARLNPDGSLDPSYGTGGTTSIAGSGANGVVRLPDGRLVIAGGFPSGSPDPGRVGRVTANGVLDTTFGTSGFATYRYDDTLRTYPAALALTTSGAVIDVGVAQETGPFYSRAAVARLTTNGALDPSFSGDGRDVFDHGTAETHGRYVEVLPSGRILLTLDRFVPVGPSSFVTQPMLQIREPDGSLVATFGSGGTLDFDGSWFFENAKAHVEPGKAIIVSGMTSDASSLSAEWLLARYDFDGNPDVAFNGGDAYRTYADPTEPYVTMRGSIAFDAEGRILSCGDVTPGGGESKMEILRIWP